MHDWHDARGIGRPHISAYSLASLNRGLFCAGFCTIGAALVPAGARPRLSPRPLPVPEGRGHHSSQELDFRLSRVRLFNSIRNRKTRPELRSIAVDLLQPFQQRVDKSSIAATERLRVDWRVMIITGVQRNAKLASAKYEHLRGGTNHFCQ